VLGFRNRITKRILESMCDKGIGGWKNKQNEKYIISYFTRHYYDQQKKEEEVS
jgi:hypothetical protein